MSGIPGVHDRISQKLLDARTKLEEQIGRIDRTLKFLKEHPEVEPFLLGESVGQQFYDAITKL
jgi:hypothetical protein